MIPALVGLLALAVFLPTLSNSFVDWDDDRNITGNPDFRGLAWSNIRWMFSTHLMGHFQPLSWLTLGLDYTIWGMNPLGYHLTNSVLHGISAGLLTLVLARLFALRPSADAIPTPAAPPTPGIRELLMAAAVALLWAVHPLRVEAVAWATQRREVLCSVLTLWTILHHLRGGRWWSVALFTALAMLAKATAVVLPVMIVLIDLYRTGTFARLRLGPSGGAWIQSMRIGVRHGTLALLAVACSIMAVRAQRDAAALIDVKQLGWGGRLTEYAYSIGFYAWKTVWPTNLMPLYEARTYEAHGVVLIDTTPLIPMAAFGATMVGLALLSGWVWRACLPWLLPLAIAYPALVAPVGGLGQAGPQVAADRYTYQPGWVLTLAIAAAVWLLASRLIASPDTRRKLAAVCTLALAAGLAVLTVAQERVWHTSRELWTWVVNHDPQCGTAFYNLGLGYGEPGSGDDAKGEPLLREALRLHPWMPERSTALATLLARKGNTAEAISLYRTALTQNPNMKPAMFMLANLLYSSGQTAEAIMLFDRLAGTDPTNPESYRVLSRALAAAGRVPEAIRILDQGVVTLPTSGELWQLRAWLCATSPDDSARDGTKAVESAERALALSTTPRPGALIVCVAAAYAEAGRYADADRFLEESMRSADEATRGPLGSMRKQMQAHQPVRAPARFP